jgi:hypothetical protein
MGLFGNDQEQDARLDAHEAYIRSLAEAMQQNQLDVIKLGIALIRMEGIVNEKVNADDVDPAIAALNEQLGVARDEYTRLEAAASDTWQTLHEGATTAVSSLRDSVEEARARIEQEM